MMSGMGTQTIHTGNRFGGTTSWKCCRAFSGTLSSSISAMNKWGRCLIDRPPARSRGLRRCVRSAAVWTGDVPGIFCTMCPLLLLRLIIGRRNESLSSGAAEFETI